MAKDKNNSDSNVQLSDTEKNAVQFLMGVAEKAQLKGGILSLQDAVNVAQCFQVLGPLVAQKPQGEAEEK